MSHYARTAAEIAPTPSERYAGHAEGYARDELVGQHTGAVHTGFALAELAPNGHVDPHLHSFEESFYVLEGQPELMLDGRAHRLAPGECGLVPVGVPHAWRGGGGAARWLEMTAPAPRIAGAPDTFFTGGAVPAGDAQPLDIRDPRTRTFFRLDPGQMELDNRKLGAPVDAPTVSASMATALLAYSGITLKMLVDQRLGAVLHTMFMVEYEPGGVAQPHDHPLEEAYYMLEGEVEAQADGETLVLRTGRRLLGGRRLRARLLQPQRDRPRALARDAVAATPGQLLLPLRPRLGLPRRTPARPGPLTSRTAPGLRYAGFRAGSGVQAEQTGGQGSPLRITHVAARARGRSTRSSSSVPTSSRR